MSGARLATRLVALGLVLGGIFMLQLMTQQLEVLTDRTTSRTKASASGHASIGGAPLFTGKTAPRGPVRSPAVEPDKPENALW